MKAILLIFSGFFVTLGGFAGGAVYATALLAVEPPSEVALDINASTAWTTEPIRVASLDQELERLPAEHASATPRVRVKAHFIHEPVEVLDDMFTAAIEQEVEEQAVVSEAVIVEEVATPVDEQPSLDAHLAWCADRYRSYDPATDTYRPFSGGERPCVSPYSSEGAQEAATSINLETSETHVVEASYAAAASPRMDIRHVQSCLDRYRSYRIEDNTYQPYSGGPRRQCK